MRMRGRRQVESLFLPSFGFELLLLDPLDKELSASSFMSLSSDLMKEFSSER